MDLATCQTEMSWNRKAYENLRDRIRTEFAGNYVALARGQVIAATATFDEALSAIRELQSQPEYYMIFPAESEPNFDLVYDL